MSRGDPVPPVVTSRGFGLARGENSVSDLLDATFGTSPSMALIRGANGWIASPTSSFGGILTFTWALGVTISGTPTPVAVATNPASIYLICSDNGTFNRVDMIAVTGPTGAALIVDILRSADHGTTFSSIFSVKPQIAAGSVQGGGSAVFSQTSINQMDLLRLDVSPVGSSTAANNVTVVLEVYT